MVHILNSEDSIANSFLAELRNIDIQKDRMRFRTNIERIGMLMAYEISKELYYSESWIQTPLAKTKVTLCKDEIVVATILRAGMPFMQGFLNMFDRAEAAFVGAARGKHNADHSFDIDLDYVACPDLNGKILIICDPMLATGRSLKKAYQSLLTHGTPKHVFIASVISSPEGVSFVKKELPNVDLWVAAIDEKLNIDSYIVPGLGDAGDLSFGEKL
ncbi:MAG: uracil phosphoribosyltransferase [Bacteroidetes bacterium]|nr:uracil phosphoribosyltransferase [Bacteroidota bacterium]